MHPRSRHFLLGLALAGAACGGGRKEPAVSAAASAAPAAPQPAQVQAVLHAHGIAPHESLAVRLLGVVGADGGWSLREVDVQQRSGHVRISPQVQYVAARNVIQMVMPLDELLWLHLEPGVHRLEIVGRDSTFTSEVRVVAGFERPPPETHGAYQIVSSAAGARDFVAFTAWSANGFADAIEVREHRAAGAGEWRRLQGCQREGDKLVGRIQVQASGDLVGLEGRAVDGQAGVDPTPAYIAMESR